MIKKKIYLNEYNVLMEGAIYLPVVSGSLQAYAQSIEGINESYEFQPTLFMREDLEKIITKYKDPSVVAFSASMWNNNLSLEVAKRVKKKFPKSLIIFGGPEVPFNTNYFFKKYPFVDVTVRGEGEKTFSKLLLRFLEGRNFKDIPGISYKSSWGEVIREACETELEKKLEAFPSPYLNGTFDPILNSNKEIKFQAIIETNRGCPYGCSFCSWGKGGLSKKFRFFNLERIEKLAEWCGKNKIDYVFCADSNFGAFKRDIEISEFFLEAKKRYGYPEKFRVCYAKNSEETVFKIGTMLHEKNMEKGITLSRQSNKKEVLENIGRKNISMKTFTHLQKRYNEKGIPTYTELILGLPGETYESFAKGIEEILKTGVQNQLFIYHCQVYPNTDLADTYLQKKFGIKTKKIPLNETHGVVHKDNEVIEYENIIVSTNSLSEENWKKATILSWTIQMIHGLKLGYYLTNYLNDKYDVRRTDFFQRIVEEGLKTKKGILQREIYNFSDAAENIIRGNPRCRILPEFGNVYWDQEEAAFLNIAQEKERFYEDLLKITKNFLKDKKLNFNKEELEEVLKYQKSRIPSLSASQESKVSFEMNIPEYFQKYEEMTPIKIERKKQVMKIKNLKEYKNRNIFASEVIMRGRKSNKIAYPIIYNS